MSYFNDVQSFGFPLDDVTFTYRISGSVTAADVGKAVTLDTTAANTVKLAGDNDFIFGRLKTVEVRTNDGITVGAVQRQFKEKLPSTGVIAIGAAVSGSATAGVVKSATAQTEPKPNRVVETGTGFVVVEQL